MNSSKIPTINADAYHWGNVSSTMAGGGAGGSVSKLMPKERWNKLKKGI